MTHTHSKTGNTGHTGAKPCGCGGGCGCHDNPPAPSTCCKLTCFERPSYFCGQLLSDADLTLQENYFREKSKLYHRTLDGYGVVCGLRMYCDHECKGSITIGDGYAIDCCGNDMVVCQPMRFDVIAELRKKKWLLETPRDHHKKKFEPLDREGGEQRDDWDREDRDQDPEECLHRQCFYIGICYEEQPSDYVTPYATDCTPGPGPCQPTRIKEGVRFEIYEKLPQRPNPLTEIEKRIERCFKLFREGQFSLGLRRVAPEILRILCQDDPARPAGPNNEQNPPDAYQTFCELRVQFLHQLRICPDQYNCNLEREVAEIKPPSRGDNNPEGNTPVQAFTRLLELIQQYVFSCVLAEFAFLCPEPPEACCVVIGAVEVENGRLTRVINYPRWYLWCFANFFEVLSYTLANEAACGRSENKFATEAEREPLKPHRGGCCPTIEVDPCEFLTLFLYENRAGETAARTLVSAILALYQALVDGTDFMTKGGISPAVLKNRPLQEANAMAKPFGFTVEDLGPAPTGGRDPWSAILEVFMHRSTETMGAFTQNRQDTLFATRATQFMQSPPREAHSPRSDAELKNTAELKSTIERLQHDLDELKRRIPTPPPEAPEGGHIG